MTYEDLTGLTMCMYLRKSRADDINDSIEDTLRRHKDTLSKLAAEYGWIVSHIYEEVVSGDSLYARPEMLRLLEDVEAKKYQAVLVMDIDRLGRGSMSDQGVILDTFKASGAIIVTPRKIYDLNNELDEEYTEFETFMARRELKLIKRRLQRGIRKTIEEGGYIANAPYGYEKTTIGKRPTLKINESEAVYVRMIFDMYVNKGIGCQIIADTLNSLGAKPHRAASFGRTSIQHILKNPTFCGKVVWDQKQHIRKGSRGNEKHITIYNPQEQWTIVDGIHPAIVSEEIWREAQKIMHSRYHSPYFDGEVKNPIAGIVYCAKCGSIMQRRPYGSRGEPDQLICPTRGCCASSHLEYVESAVIDGIKKELDVLRVEQAKGIKRGGKDYSDAIKAAEKELATVKSQKDKLHDLLEQGVYDTNTFLERSSALNKRMDTISKSIDDLEEMQASQKQINYAATIRRIENALDAYSSADTNVKNDILKSIVSRAEYFKEKGWKPQQFIVSVEISPIYI